MAEFPAYELQYKMYRWTGMAKNDFENKTKRILYRIYDLFLTFSYSFFDACYIYVLVATAKDSSFKDILMNGMSFLICLGVLGKRIFVLGNKDTIKELYLRIKADFENPLMKNVKDAEAIIEKFDGEYKRNLNIIYVLGFMTVFLYCMPGYLYFPEEIPFPIPFLHYLNSFQILMIVNWEVLLICIGYFNFLAYDSLVWGFLMLISTRLQVIAKMWEDFADDYPSIEFKKYVREYEGYPRQSERHRKYNSYDEYMRHDKKIVEDTVQFVKKTAVYYQEITEEVGIVEKVFSFPLLIHMFGGAILIGITIVFVIIGGINTWNGYRTFAFFMSTIWNLFVFSLYGTKVDEAKKTLAAAVYESPWHEGDAQTGKLAMYTMSMMRNNLHYTAGGFIVINLESYLSLMKLSYNLLAVLK